MKVMCIIDDLGVDCINAEGARDFMFYRALANGHRHAVYLEIDGIDADEYKYILKLFKEGKYKEAAKVLLKHNKIFVPASMLKKFEKIRGEFYEGVPGVVERDGGMSEV